MKNLILAVIIATCCFGGAIAQNNNNAMQQSDNTNRQKDNDFVQKALEGGLSEVKLGELGQSRGASSQVREFGRMMVNDHQKANKELRELVQQNGYTDLPMVVPSGSQKDYDKLAGKSGADFDKAFAKQMVDDHEKTIKLFRKQAENGKDAQLRNWAAQTLPVLEQHLAHAKRLEETVKNNK